MRLKVLVVVLAALFVSVVLAGCSSSTESGSAETTQPAETTQSTETTQKTPDQQVAPDVTTAEDTGGEETVAAPEDKGLTLTVPKLKQVEGGVKVPTGAADARPLFNNNAAVHLQSTGFPWQKGANVYIAGHRLGYSNTPSYHAFYDIDDLKNGDKIFLEDSMGRKYTYEVYKTLVVPPQNTSVVNPVKGKSVISLQACTLPDYSKRIIVRGELVKTTQS